MRKRIDAWGDYYEVQIGAEHVEPELEHELIDDVEAASRFLDECRGDHFNMQRLRALYHEDQPAAGPSSDADLLREVSRRLARGELQIAHCPAQVPPPASTIAETVVPPRRRTQEATTWIEIVLVDENDRPSPGVTYQVAHASGGVAARGQLDEDGQARVEKLKPGNYKVSFPELDEEAWAKA